MEIGQLTVRNVSGETLSLRGHNVVDGTTVDLVRPSAPAACCFYSYAQARSAWDDPGSWLGQLRLSGDLELDSDAPVDLSAL